MKRRRFLQLAGLSCLGSAFSGGPVATGARHRVQQKGWQMSAEAQWLSVDFWNGLMGKRLQPAEVQPLEVVDNGDALRVGSEEDAQVLPIRVVEHPPDVLGPRFLDELQGDCIVRHAIPGPTRDEWAGECLEELAGMACSAPWRIDPVDVLAQGDDWVGWMTRNRILASPRQDDPDRRPRFVADIADGQQEDGSWGGVPATAYAVLNLLALGVPTSDERVQRAARWLLNRPEPPPRPGTWMLTDEYMEEWLSRREPREEKEFGRGEFHWVPPDESVNFYCWDFPAAEQDQFRGPHAQQVVPICARHHPPACEPRLTHTSTLVAQALMRCGFADQPRLRRYVNTVFHLGGEWGYWCGCGALGLYDADIPPSGESPDFDVRGVAEDGQTDLSAWRWVAGPEECRCLANEPEVPERGTHLEPFRWHRVPGQDRFFALLGTGWQNGDCWAKTNRALAAHPGFAGSVSERLAVFQASRYQNSLGEWDQAYPAGMLSFLSLLPGPEAKALAMKTVPWLRENQAEDGLWHHETLLRNDWGKPATPAAPRLASYHIVAGLSALGLLERLRPR
ncbi:MAG: hypothetical protein PVJ27_07595 [Candidatus Brocadiaceae bacterium]|jgi:hypothetical protein